MSEPEQGSTPSSKRGKTVHGEPANAGHRVLAIRGGDDRNVPVGGGVGSKGFSKVAFESEAHAQEVVRAAGGQYTLLLVPGADHFADHIDAALKATGQGTIGEQAVRFFGLAMATPATP